MTVSLMMIQSSAFIARHWKTEAAHTLAIDLQPVGRSATKSCYWTNDDSSIPIIIDTGASVLVSPNEADFIGPITAIPGGKKIEGLNSQVQVEGHGRVRWTVHDKNGCEGTIESQAYYIPPASIRLMRPQTYFQEGERGRYEMTDNGVLLELHDTTVLQFPFDLRHNLPSMGAPIGTAAARLGADPGHSNDTCYDPFLEGAFDPRFGSDCFGRDIFSQPSESALITLDVAGSPNPNLSIPQKELLVWHWRLGHAHMSWIQRIMRPSKIPRHKND
jgi:hypothetical protein